MQLFRNILGAFIKFFFGGGGGLRLALRNRIIPREGYDFYVHDGNALIKVLGDRNKTEPF